MIKNTAILMIIYVLIGSVLGSYYYGAAMALALLMGGFAMLVSFCGLWFFWHLVFSKKSIALASMVIIFKYVVLGLILWIFASVRGLSSIGFLIGLGSLLFAIFGAALIRSFSKTKS